MEKSSKITEIKIETPPLRTSPSPQRSVPAPIKQKEKQRTSIKAAILESDPKTKILQQKSELVMKESKLLSCLKTVVPEVQNQKPSRFTDRIQNENESAPKEGALTLIKSSQILDSEVDVRSLSNVSGGEKKKMRKYQPRVDVNRKIMVERVIRSVSPVRKESAQKIAENRQKSVIKENVKQQVRKSIGNESPTFARSQKVRFMNGSR